LQIPLRIPGIELVHELGHGAHSIVYRARLNGRPCAIKLPRTSGRWVRWVYREAVALARVRHAALPRVLEVGEANGTPYLAMELVEGETLADRLARSPLGEGSTMELGLTLANALAAVHDAGLVHRDVKPRNIIIERSGSIRLVDFGFAVPVELLASGAEGGAGTPMYAAPEQFRSASRVDGRSDLYGVGLVMRECLGPARTSLGLERIITDLISDSPDDRYPDARALQEDLQLVLGQRAPRGASAYVGTPREPQRPVRERQLVTLQKLTAGLEKKGGLVAVVRGAAGSGKSHLLAAFDARSAEHGAQVVMARCRPGDAALATMSNVVVALASQPEGRAALKAAADHELAAFVRLCAPVLDETQEGDGPPSELMASSAQFAEAMAEVLVRVTSIRGAVHFVVDDVQWLDPVSREVLERFAYRIHETRSLLVLGVRTEAEGKGLAELISALPPSRVTVIDLESLSTTQTEALVATHLGVMVPDESLTRRVAALADGTPLGVLNLLGAFLDVGAVRPQAGGWHYDAARADNIELGRGAVSLLERRVAALPKASRSVMDAAAVLGPTFDDARLARLFGLSPWDLDYALDDGRRNGLIERDKRGRHRFVHDSLRDMLVAALSPQALRALHQRLAETIEVEPNKNLHTLCARADHYAQGETERAPGAVFRAATEAAQAVLLRFDNEMALRYLDLQESVAERAGCALDMSFYRMRGEAALRVGAFELSLASFRLALSLTEDRLMRATLLGRIAWVHQICDQPDASRAVLEQAFGALSARFPSEAPLGAAFGFAGLALGELSAYVIDSRPTASQAELELLCELYYQCARIGMEYGKPLLLVHSALAARKMAEHLPPSRARARAHAMVGVVATAVGRVESGRERLAEGKRMALSVGDPATHTFCLQLEAMAASIAGNLDEALALFRTCIEERGHWLELHEYCMVAMTIDMIEVGRGRVNAAWAGVSLAVERLRRNHRVDEEVGAFIILRACASRAEAGHVLDDDPWLRARYDAALGWAETGSGFSHLSSWGARLRTIIVSRGPASEVETLARKFSELGMSPGSAHLAVSDYFVSVAHNRADALLSAPITERAALLPALKKATSDLCAAAKIPLLHAHARLAEAHLAWHGGDLAKARKLMGEAEQLAEQESCYWVLFELARTRAHMLQEQGRRDASRLQARVAHMLAVECGAVARAALVREEFQLPAPEAPERSELGSSVKSASRRAQRQLASLLHVVGAAHPGMRPTQHAEIILDNLVRDLEAECATLWFQSDAASEVRLVRNRAGVTLPPTELNGFRDELMRRVRTSGEPWPPRGDSVYGVGTSVDPKRVMIHPLFLYDAPVGAVCIERRSVEAPWGREDREVFELVSHQIPVAIEIVRLLSERAEMQTHLQQIQKMEAVGQLAGGVAHDFNNMLVVVKASVDAIGERTNLDAGVTEELTIISQATDRAARLTKELLSFSRHQPASFSEVDVNLVVNELLPMLQRMVGPRVRVDVRLGRNLPPIYTDRPSLEQAIVNLAINARDAIVETGELIITTRESLLDEDAVRRGAPKAGEYVTIDVADNGCGMTKEVRERVFDPFFTTKPVGSGTGLGMTTVYGFVKHSGGHIHLESEVGKGTTFHIHLPPSEDAVRHKSEKPSRTSLTSRPPRATHTILVVDDDQLVRESVLRVLSRAGYKAYAASGAPDALEIMENRRNDISLVVLDVVMPGMTGPELAQQFAERHFPAKVLFVSGFAPGNLPVEAKSLTRETLLQKPFEGADLLRRVAQMLDHHVGNA
jgi:signal transduction histidine kinase/serine/threonine protein kinase/ActR/RegA family two-component response regulator